MDLTSPAKPLARRFGLVDLIWVVAATPFGPFAWSFRRHFLFEMYGHQVAMIPEASIDWLFVASTKFFGLAVVCTIREKPWVGPRSIHAGQLACVIVVGMVPLVTLSKVLAMDQYYPETRHVGSGQKWLMLSLRSIQTIKVTGAPMSSWSWIALCQRWRWPASRLDWLGCVVGGWFIVCPYVWIALSNQADRYDQSMFLS